MLSSNNGVVDFFQRNHNKTDMDDDSPTYFTFFLGPMPYLACCGGSDGGCHAHGSRGGDGVGSVVVVDAVVMVVSSWWWWLG